MGMNPIHSVDAPFRRVSGEIQDQTASHNGKMQSGGQDARVWPEWLRWKCFLPDVEAGGGMVMIDSLREIHIKICSARIVMYSQRHIC